MKIKIIDLDYIDEDAVNDFIRYIKVIDIKYQRSNHKDKILIMYEE